MGKVCNEISEVVFSQNSTKYYLDPSVKNTPFHLNPCNKLIYYALSFSLYNHLPFELEVSKNTSS